jgi:hypothetical protein
MVNLDKDEHEARKSTNYDEPRKPITNPLYVKILRRKI